MRGQERAVGGVDHRHDTMLIGDHHALTVQTRDAIRTDLHRPVLHAIGAQAVNFSRSDGNHPVAEEGNRSGDRARQLGGPPNRNWGLNRPVAQAP